MAIQVSGTEVISNARALTNIASVDATTVATLNAAGGARVALSLPQKQLLVQECFPMEPNSSLMTNHLTSTTLRMGILGQPTKYLG